MRTYENPSAITEATALPKMVGFDCYNSFVFSDRRGEWDGGFCRFLWIWPTSAKSGGFRPVGRREVVFRLGAPVNIRAVKNPRHPQNSAAASVDKIVNHEGH